MTIQEAIDRLNSLVPNNYGDPDKLMWLSSLDGDIFKNIMEKREGNERPEWVPYTPHTDKSTVLLVGNPYEEMYVLFMEAKVHYYDKEMEDYNNAYISYKTLFDQFSAAYSQAHKSKTPKIRYF